MLRINGWASTGNGTTGGKGGKVVSVRNSTDFKNAVTGSTPTIVQVNGKIDIGYCQIGANKTIVGMGLDAELNGTVRIETGNVIAKNVSVTNPAGDGFAVAGAKSIFISQCTVRDCSDGECDITKGADLVTVEYSKFYYNSNGDHNLAALIGASDTASDSGLLNCTLHHNYWWKNINDRMPRVRFGKVHVYNNLYDPYTDHKVSACVTAAINSQILVENNLFLSGEDAWYYYGGQNGKIKALGNVFGPKWTASKPSGGNDTVFKPPYEYTLEPANDLGYLANAAGVNGDSDLTEDGGGQVEPPIEPPITPIEPPIEPPVTTAKLEIAAGDDIVVELPKDFTTIQAVVRNLKKGVYTLNIGVIGNDEEAYDELAIIVRGDATAPSDSLVKGFILVNAATDRELIAMGEGAFFSLSKYGNKLSIKADVSDTSVVNVKFELSGVQAKVYTDKAQPFSLWGDDGRGNYYYGTWNPPALGKYKLVATPINAAGQPLQSKEINFSFVA
jgi:pectate lyase